MPSLTHASLPNESAAGALIVQVSGQPIWVGNAASTAERCLYKIVGATEPSKVRIGTPNGLIKGHFTHIWPLNATNLAVPAVVHSPPVPGATPSPDLCGAKWGRGSEEQRVYSYGLPSDRALVVITPWHLGGPDRFGQPCLLHWGFSSH